MARASWFEIPAADLDRAAAFYEALLGSPLERDVVDGHDAAYLPAPDGEGAAGALMHGDSYVPSLEGTRIYLGVDDVESSVARALAAGGDLLYPPTRVGELVVAEVSDSEGNRIALSADAQPDPEG
ncbi:MAG: VOC family protein [Candidatus Nanopelagicales bacterium]|jgi:predicted enzyme related to lactoylglutathione lyase